MNQVDKEFCDERSGNILSCTAGVKEDILQVKKAVDRITWLLITTLISVCGSLIVLLSSHDAQSFITAFLHNLG